MKKAINVGLIFLTLFAFILFSACKADTQTGTKKETKENEGAMRVPEEKVVKLYATAGEYGKTISGYHESPKMTELVNAGKLPSIEERLPEEPMIVAPSDSIGKYGGTIRRAWKGYSDKTGVDKFLGERLMQWGAHGELTPGVIRNLEISEDGLTVTMTLRKGLKWSDGHPVTTKDVDFHYNKYYHNPELFSLNSMPQLYKPGDVPGVLKIIDDYTCQYIFEKPAAIFIGKAASRNYWEFLQPAHYLKQFHPEYTDRATLDKLVAEGGYNKLINLFTDRNNPLKNPDLPVLLAWQIANDYTDQQVFYKRNPYYFKVDTEGNQLPYIDEVVNIFVEDVEMLVMKAVAGDLDFQTRDLKIANYTLFMENKAKGGYNVLMYPAAMGSDTTILLNHSVKDDTKRELFNNPKFKQALSLAINREEVNQINHMGLAVPRQASFASTGYVYDKEWESLYTQYDIDKANALLDELGMTEKNDEGIRLMKDGNPLEITIEFYLDYYTKDMEIVKNNWSNIGVKLNIKLEDRALMYTRYRQDNAQEALCWTFDRITRPDLDLTLIVPATERNSWASQWGLYYKTKGKSGIKPPADIQKLQDLMDELLVTVQDDKRKSLVQDIIDLHKKNLFIIGVVGLEPKIAVVNKKLKNIPYFMHDEAFRTPGNSYPQQFYYEN